MDYSRVRQNLSPQPKSSREIANRRKTILVIGCEPLQLGLTQAILSVMGYQALVASSLRGAFAAVANHRPDVILAMNLMNYFRTLAPLLAQIETTPNIRRPPLLVISGMPHLEASRMRAWVPGFKPGYDALVPKPCEMPDMLWQVNAAMERSLP